MHDPMYWMWARACQMLERAERMQRDFYRVESVTTRHVAWQPPADVLETDRNVWIFVALPGVTPEYLSVAFDGHAVIVSGERHLPVELRRAAIHRLEIPHGRFERRVVLPRGRYEPDYQEFNHGMLVIGLRRTGY